MEATSRTDTRHSDRHRQRCKVVREGSVSPSRYTARRTYRMAQNVSPQRIMPLNNLFNIILKSRFIKSKCQASTTGLILFTWY